MFSCNSVISCIPQVIICFLASITLSMLPDARDDIFLKFLQHVLHCAVIFCRLLIYLTCCLIILKEQILGNRVCFQHRLLK